MLPAFAVLLSARLSRTIVPRVRVALVVVFVCLSAASSLANAMVVRVRWTPSTDPAVVGYKVYTRLAGKAYGAPQLVNPPLQADHTVSFDVGGLTAGPTYYFAVSAYEANGTESMLSNELPLGPTNPCLIDRCSTPTACEFAMSPDGAPCSGSDLCSVCQTGTCQIVPPLQLVARQLHLATNPLGDRIRASGTARVPGPVMPSTTGVSVDFADAGGAPLYSLDVPASAFKGNPAGTSFQIRRGFRQDFGWMQIKSLGENLTINLNAVTPELAAFARSGLTWMVRFGPGACLQADLSCTGSGRMITCG